MEYLMFRVRGSEGSNSHPYWGCFVTLPTHCRIPSVSPKRRNKQITIVPTRAALSCEMNRMTNRTPDVLGPVPPSAGLAGVTGGGAGVVACPSARATFEPRNRRRRLAVRSLR